MADKPFSLSFEGAAFGAFLTDMAQDVEDEMLPDFMRKTMFDLAASVIQKTPIDTGRARGGWLAVEKLGGSIPVAGPGVSEGKALSKLRDKLDGPQQFIELVNAVAYITELEFGSSSQAPGGMVRITMREFAAQANLGDGVLDAIENTFTSANIRARTRGRKLPG